MMLMSWYAKDFFPLTAAGPVKGIGSGYCAEAMPKITRRNDRRVSILSIVSWKRLGELQCGHMDTAGH